MPSHRRAGGLEGGNEKQSHGLRLHRHLDSDGNPSDLLCTHVLPVELEYLPARRVETAETRLAEVQPATATHW